LEKIDHKYLQKSYLQFGLLKMTTKSFVHRLISQINTYPKLSDSKGLFEKFPVTLKDLPQVKIPEKNYTRHLLYVDPMYAIVGIAWRNNSYTNYHSHPSNGCLFKVISGSILEFRDNDCIIYKPYDQETNFKGITNANDTGSEISIVNEAGYIDNTMGKHQMFAPESSISLHIYSPSEEVLKNYMNPPPRDGKFNPTIDLREIDLRDCITN